MNKRSSLCLADLPIADLPITMPNSILHAFVKVNLQPHFSPTASPVLSAVAFPLGLRRGATPCFSRSSPTLHKRLLRATRSRQRLLLGIDPLPTSKSASAIPLSAALLSKVACAKGAGAPPSSGRSLPSFRSSLLHFLPLILPQVPQGCNLSFPLHAAK